MFSMSLDACFQQTQSCFPFEACLENQGLSFFQCWLLQYFKIATTQNNKILKILVLAKHEQNNTKISKEDKELRKTMDLDQINHGDDQVCQSIKQLTSIETLGQKTR